MITKSVTNNIKQMRFNTKNMSQQELANLVGCTRQTIISLEKNKYSPSYLLVVKVAKVFGVTPKEVIRITLESEQSRRV
ncbi:helix-turn-helix protein [Candidatus Izimaplasma bacterium HR1]|jgi:putative transcriptional regulator|uniref:helix-turn-helix transcriptional regulator n=1 Tax=Candidatus Izimoplasma sp. HR1 TaxID=1541959 RepID=UPI0004F8D216|nr:helix-turn-helix protein [Candidatus Izimaplasma bacterium HR1]